MTHYILIHGAFHTAKCWDALSGELERRGHSTDAVDLPSAGRDHTPLTEVTLDGAVDTVLAAVENADSQRAPDDVVLVAHSMGGIVATQTLARASDRIHRIVYVASFRPIDGECLIDLASRTEFGQDGVQPNITALGDPPSYAVMDPEAAPEIFYGDGASEDAALWTRDLVHQPLSLFTTPVTLDAPIGTATSYVVCTKDRAIPPGLQRHMATRNPSDLIELASDHSPFLTHTLELADILTPG